MSKYLSFFLQKKKTKKENMVVKDTKIYQNMKNNTWLDIERNIIKSENTLWYN